MAGGATPARPVGSGGGAAAAHHQSINQRRLPRQHRAAALRHGRAAQRSPACSFCFRLRIRTGVTQCIAVQCSTHRRAAACFIIAIALLALRALRGVVKAVSAVLHLAALARRLRFSQIRGRQVGWKAISDRRGIQKCTTRGGTQTQTQRREACDSSSVATASPPACAGSSQPDACLLNTQSGAQQPLLL